MVISLASRLKPDSCALSGKLPIRVQRVLRRAGTELERHRVIQKARDDLAISGDAALAEGRALCDAEHDQVVEDPGEAGVWGHATSVLRW